MVQSRLVVASTTILLCLTHSLVAGADEENLTAYDVLRSYDFPEGLLPKGVIGYELDRSTGRFTAHLNGSCSFSISGYKLRYKSTITGRISKDRITNLKGISVKVLLFWVNIVEVVRSDDELEFSVGIASADFPVDNFLESPSCGCGFDCRSSEKKAGGIRSSIPYVSSS